MSAHRPADPDRDPRHDCADTNLDSLLHTARHRFVEELTAVLDIDAGLQAAMESGPHIALTDELATVLNLERGLAAATGQRPATFPSAQPILDLDSLRWLSAPERLGLRATSLFRQFRELVRFAAALASLDLDRELPTPPSSVVTYHIDSSGEISTWASDDIPGNAIADEWRDDRDSDATFITVQRDRDYRITNGGRTYYHTAQQRYIEFLGIYTTPPLDEVLKTDPTVDILLDVADALHRARSCDHQNFVSAGIPDALDRVYSRCLDSALIQDLYRDCAFPIVPALGRARDLARLLERTIERREAAGRYCVESQPEDELTYVANLKAQSRAGLERVVERLDHAIQHQMHVAARLANLEIDANTAIAETAVAVDRVLTELTDDFVGLDLRDAELSDLPGVSDLDGVQWSEATVWPTGWRRRVQALSVTISPGIYEVISGPHGRRRARTPASN